MIELTDQSVLYIGILMYAIFMTATFIEFRKMTKRAAMNAKNQLKKKHNKEVPIKRMNVANYR